MRRTFITVILLVILQVGNAEVTGSFNVKGNVNTYYPVTFVDNGWSSNIATELKLGRSDVHVDQATITANGGWVGSFTAQFKFHTTNWGNGSPFINAEIFQGLWGITPVITNFIGGWQDISVGNGEKKIVIWLRGGSVTYFYTANLAVTPTVYDGVANALPYSITNGGSVTSKTTPDANVVQNGLSFNGNMKTNTLVTGGVAIANAGDNFLTTNQNNKNYHLIGTYAGWDADAIYIAGYNQYNNSAVSNVTKVYIGGGAGGKYFKFDLNTGNCWINSPNALPNFVDNYSLNVNGNIRANKLVVNTTGADFVFEPSYKLIPLTQLEKYLTTNRHLPGIETANIMQKDGVDVGDNQTKLLQKIEELTLYIIEQSKTLRSQAYQLQQLQKQVDNLKASKK